MSTQPPQQPYQQQSYQTPYQPQPSGVQWQQPSSGQPQYPPQQYGQSHPQQQMPYTPPMQQPYMQAQPAIMQTNVNVNVQQRGPGFLTRAIYFLFIGWWLGLFWLNLGFFLCFLILPLPLGLAMLNRLPQVMTLKSPGTSTRVNVSNTMMTSGPGGPMISTTNVNVTVGGTQQYNFLIRAIYFLLVGWWAGYLWANLAYVCFVSVLLLPVGLLMLNWLPMILTLRKN